MLHAVIQWERDALHFFGEVTSYNLQTLRLHVRDRLRDGGAPRLRIEIDPEDRSAFVQQADAWLAQLRDAGTTVEIMVRGVVHGRARRAGDYPTMRTEIPSRQFAGLEGA